MESIVLKRKQILRDKGNNKTQYGGRKRIGTSYVLADVAHEVPKATQKGGIAVGFFFDYSAAFNTGHLDDMIKGLKNQGFPNKNYIC